MTNSIDELQSLKAEQQRRQQIEREYLRAERARRSLSHFLREAWKIVEPSAPLQWGWHIDAMAEHLEAVESGQIQNLLITIPPGCTKSILIGVMFPAWGWCRNPSMRWLCAANEGDLATRDSTLCRNIIESDWYRLHFPEVQLVGDQNVKTWYKTSKQGHRQAVTVASKATGKKGDILIVDDPNDAAKVESEAERKAVIHWWKDTFFDRVNNFKTGRRIVVGQRTHRNDLQGFIKESGGFEELCIPEEYEPARKTFTSIGWSDPRQIAGELLRPDRFGTEEVAGARKRLGTIGYNAKHQQRPESKEGYRFKDIWLQGTWRITWDGYMLLERPGHPEIKFPAREMRTRFGTADGAASAATSADYTVVSSWHTTPRNDLLWIGCNRIQAEIPDQPAIVEAEYEKHQLEYIGIEAELSNVALFQHSKRTRMNVKKLTTERKDKLARATPALVFCEAGRLYLPHPEQCPDFPFDAVRAELLAFTGDDKIDEHDDIVDTLAYAVKCNTGPGVASAPAGVGGLNQPKPETLPLTPKPPVRKIPGVGGVGGLIPVGGRR